MQADLTDKVAFVTGSTNDIGKAIALKLAQNGADIILNGRRSEPAVPIIEKINSFGRRAIFEKADITEYSQIRQAMQNAIQKLGKIDILVVSGGVSNSGLKPQFFHETDPADYPLISKGQWWSRLYCIRAVLDHMQERKIGKIVLITTDAGRWPTPAESVVGGAGAAVVLGTKVLAQELSRWKIRVNAISTTVIEGTSSFNNMLTDAPSMGYVFKKALEKQPFKISVEDIAEACLMFSSKASDGITGQVLSVNGGLCFP